MALTRDFKNTVKDRALHDIAFRYALLRESVQCLLAGDLGTGKMLLRDYINATLGFDELASLMDKPSKSLMRMFGPNGNPRADNIFAVLSALQKKEGITLHVRAENKRS